VAGSGHVRRVPADCHLVDPRSRGSRDNCDRPCTGRPAGQLAVGIVERHTPQ
jgi:hypothetical protein